MCPLGNPKNVDADGPNNVVLVTTAETVVCTLVIGDDTQEGDQVVLEAVANVSGGTGTTSVVGRIRRNGLAGAQVGQVEQLGLAGTGLAELAMQVDDLPGEVASQTYVLTVALVGATGNGTCNTSNMQATY